MIRAVIFDLDGTLVDSNEMHVEAWDRAFRHFGRVFSREALHRQVGKGADQYMPAFLTPEEIEASRQRIGRVSFRLFRGLNTFLARFGRSRK